jgi:hypothetical protein
MLLGKTWRVCLIAVVFLSWWVSPAGAVTPAKLIGPDLKARVIDVSSLNDGTLHYFDEQRTLRSSAIDGFVQLRSIGGDDGGVSSRVPGVWLIDGQRFSGEWVGPTPDGLGLRWRHPLIGMMVIPLEEVSCVNWLAGDSRDRLNDTPTADVVTLVNGDTLSGFVSSLAEQGVVLVPDGAGVGAGGGAVTIPYGRIASMVLSNPDRSVVEPYHRLTLTDGTRVWADRLQISGGVVTCRVIPSGGSGVEVQVPVGELSRIDFWAGGLRLIDLTELPMRTTKEAGVFGLSIPVRVSGRSIRMHAPVSVVFELPEGTDRFAAIAELDTENAPTDIADWSDFQVVVSVEDAEAGRLNITGIAPVGRINVPVSGEGLTIRLDPGVNGPILDRLLLRDAVILVRRPGSGLSGDSDR